MAKKHIRWVIVNDDGCLYTGQWLTRREAIAGHVCAGRRMDEPEVSGFAMSGLSVQQMKMWARRRKEGDRAIKAAITYQQG